MRRLLGLVVAALTDFDREQRLMRAMRTTTLPLALVGLALVIGSTPALATAVHCGDSITQHTTLDTDLVGCPGTGIVIAADNVRLDLHAHTISGHSAGLDAGLTARRPATR